MLYVEILKFLDHKFSNLYANILDRLLNQYQGNYYWVYDYFKHQILL